MCCHNHPDNGSDLAVVKEGEMTPEQDYKERYEHQYEMKCKAEDERDAAEERGGYLYRQLGAYCAVLFAPDERVERAESHYRALQGLRNLLPEFGPMDGRVWRLIDDELEMKTYRVPRVPSVPYR